MASAIVIDLGSGYIKASYSDAAEPSCVLPSLVGKPRRRYMEQYRGNPVFTGKDAVESRDKLSLFSPIDHGHIEDWNLMDEIWTHIFGGKYGLNPESTGLLITQPPKASRTHQQKIVETVFEMFGTPELSIQVQGILSLYSTALTTGLTCEIGEGVTQIVPVVEGALIPEGVQRIDCGGQELTMYLQKLLCNNGFAFTTRDDFEYCRLIKESYCYVPLDPSAEDMRTDLETKFSLPDGFQLRDGTQQLTIGPERFYCPEALFNPGLIEKDHLPLHDLLMGTIAKCPIDLRTSMLEHLILSGGSTLFPGLETRLSDTLARLVPRAKQQLIKVRKPENGVYAVWQGGKISADMKEVHSDVWIPLSEYQELGDSCVERVLRDGAFVQDELWVFGSKVISPEEGLACGRPIERKNCYNKIIAPGFIDIQLNGAYGVDFTATDDMSKALSQCSLLLTQTGCTAYCPTIITSDPEEYKARLKLIPFTPGSSKRGASILGIHTEGPYISMQKRGCHPPCHVKAIPRMESLEEAKKFLDATYGPDRSNIVMLTLAPENEGAKEVITVLAQEGIVVSMGHSESSYVTGCAGVAAGARALTHLFSAMNAFGHKEPALPGMISGRIPEPPKLADLKLTVKFQEARQAEINSLAGESLLPPRLRSVVEEGSEKSEYCSTNLHYGLIADCVHTHPYSLTIAFRANKHGLCLITDAMAALGLPDGEYRLGDTEVVVGGSPRRALKKGTDVLAGVVASLDHCVRLFAEQTQCGLAYALTAASLHPARCLGISEWKGHLGVGADADIILIDDNVKVYETWCMGEKAYDIVEGLSAPDLPSDLKALAHVVPPESLTRTITY